MRQLSAAGQTIIDEIARRHGFSIDGTLHMLDAVINGNGSMAQFDHPDFSGSGQWRRGGMTMVSDMFNNQLKGRIDGLCAALSSLVAAQPDLLRSGSFQSQSQGGGHDHVQAQTSRAGHAIVQQHPESVLVSESAEQGLARGSASSSLFVPPVPGTTGDWWPADLRWPDSTGSQNGVRYACFAQARRLVIDVDGTVTVYDTGDHQIGGFGQQQSVGGTLSFSHQYGLIDVQRLAVISVNGQPPPEAPGEARRTNSPDLQTLKHAAPPAAGEQDIFAMIERLADLRAKGILSDEEFQTKKSELLHRL